MIFVCVGSREYQFNRLIKQIDLLIENDTIKDTVYGQIGQSTYVPKHFKYSRFMSSDEFQDYQNNADIIISHAGTGSLINSLKLRKQVISVPRLVKYKEHTDDHQTQVSAALASEGFLLEVLDIGKLGDAIQRLKSNPIRAIYNKESNILPLLMDFISENS